MQVKKLVPNAFTMANLGSGCIAVLFAFQNELEYAALFVALGIFFDFFDGFFARVLNAQSEVGLQLDSLADMVTSGLVPGIVMYQLLNRATQGDWSEGESPVYSIALFGFAITLASAYRLAKFNVDTRQTTSFIGLPTPANALLIVSLPLILRFEAYDFVNSLVYNPYFLIVLTVLSCLLLNAELPLFALKFKTWSFAENKVRYLFLLACVSFIVVFHFLAIPLIIAFYILLSLLVPAQKK